MLIPFKKDYCFNVAHVVDSLAMELTAPGSPGECGIPAPVIKTLS